MDNEYKLLTFSSLNSTVSIDFRGTRSVLSLWMFDGLNCVTSPPPHNVQFLTPDACECSVIWTEGIYSCNQVKMRSFRTRAPNPMTNIFIRSVTETQTHRKRAVSQWRQRVMQCIASPGVRTASVQQKLGEGTLPFRACGGREALLTPRGLTSSLQNCDGINFSCVKSPSLFTYLFILWQL